MNTGPYGQYQANLGDQPTDPIPLVTPTLSCAGNPNTLHLVSLVTPAMVLDTSTGTVYYSNNGSTWTPIN